MRKFGLTFLLAVLISVPLWAQSPATRSIEAEAVALPAPVTNGGMPLASALATRRSVRAFQTTALTNAELSQLLWAAQGTTDDKGHRTAPSAMARYFLTVYVATADGLYEYVPAGHKLRKLAASDLRAKLSTQPAVVAAPAVFIITGDYERAASGRGAGTGNRWVDLEAGHATQNLLLQATAIKLAGVPVGGIDPAQVTKAASLPATSQPIYLVPVGHPK